MYKLHSPLGELRISSDGDEVDDRISGKIETPQNP